MNRKNNRTEAHVVITGKSSEELTSTFLCVNQRIPYDYGKVRGYKILLDQLPIEERRHTLIRNVMGRFMASLMDPPLREKSLRRLADIACGLIR